MSKREYCFVKIILANGEKQSMFCSYPESCRNYARTLELRYGFKTVIE